MCDHTRLGCPQAAYVILFHTECDHTRKVSPLVYVCVQHAVPSVITPERAVHWCVLYVEDMRLGPCVIKPEWAVHWFVCSMLGAIASTLHRKSCVITPSGESASFVILPRRSKDIEAGHPIVVILLMQVQPVSIDIFLWPPLVESFCVEVHTARASDARSAYSEQ